MTAGCILDPDTPKYRVRTMKLQQMFSPLKETAVFFVLDSEVSAIRHEVLVVMCHISVECIK